MTDVLVIKHPAAENLMAAAVERLASTGHTLTVFDDYHQLSRSPVPRKADVLFVSSGTPCSRAFLESFSELKGVVFAGAGIGSINLKDATALGIPVARGAAALNAESMAEATIMLMLALLHDLDGAERELHDRTERPVWPSARMLKGKTVGIVGYGQIAEAVVARLQSWGVSFLICSRHLTSAAAPPNCRLAEFATLLADSDIISLHAGYTSGAPPLIGTTEFARMKRGAILINTARGGLVDEQALIEAMSQGVLGGAALDTFQTEPLPADSPLRALPNTILTPHVIGHSAEGYASMVDTAIENITRLAAGERPLFICNDDVYSQPSKQASRPMR